MNYPLLARMAAFAFIQSRFDKSDPKPEFALDDVFIVWFSKTLQNWKALVSTTLPDNMYYELTYNGDADELYIDAYVKATNSKVGQFSETAAALTAA
jgi:hypothetical protein